MKNPYNKTVKLFAKAADLFLNRVGDTVYLSEGHIVLALHVAAYDAYFRPVSGQFLALENGEKASRRGNMAMPEKSPAAADIYKCFEDMKRIASDPVFPSPFLMEYTPCRNKTMLQRMFTGNGFYIAINNMFYEVAQENGFETFWCNAAKGSISPVVACSGDYNGIGILPIRIEQEKLYSFVNAGR